MFDLTADHLTTLTALRHRLHQSPELSGEETETARLIAARLAELAPDRIWTGLGGHGVAAEFRGSAPGPTVMIRCELDGLPIAEISAAPYRSQTPGKGHLCGHDGHMAMVMGVAIALATARPARGRVILLFQPAEETGAGARAVVSDPRYDEFRPDFAYAIHNLPGLRLGAVGLCTGPAHCASRGVELHLTGKSSHAAAPEDGLSPATALAGLMQVLPRLSAGTVADDHFALATLTHCRLGAPTFGVYPGDGELRVTLRSLSDQTMATMMTRTEAEIARHAEGLGVAIAYRDVFAATVNTAAACAQVVTACQALGLPLEPMDRPLRYSEDFGQYQIAGAEAAMIFLGSGVDHPQLHNPDFDFPDALLPVGVRLFGRLIDQHLG